MARRSAPVGVAAPGVDLRVDHAWTNGVHPDPLGAELLGETQGQGVDRALRCGVVDIKVRRPRRAAADEIRTIEPPGPPDDFASRRAASRAVSKAPSTLTSKMWRIRSALMSTSLPVGATMPALAMTAVRGPSAFAAASNIPTASVSSARRP